MTKLAASKATLAFLVLIFGAKAQAEETRLPEIPATRPEIPTNRLPENPTTQRPEIPTNRLPEIPTYAPNPFKKPVTAPVNIKDNIKLLEQTLYGSLNEDKPEDLRIIGLERTIFGVSYPKAKLTLAARTAGLEKVVDRLLSGRKFYDEKRWSEAKVELNEVLKLLGSDYKSLVRAEVHYRIGMCDYELSNVGQSNPGVKVNGVMIRTCKENLSKAQDYYKSLGQLDTAQKITAFMDSFKDKSEKSFLY